MKSKKKTSPNAFLAETRQPLPVLPLKDLVVFPHMVLPLFVGRGKSIQAVEAASLKDRLVCLATQRKATDEDPKATGLYAMGTLAQILQILRLPDGAMRVMLEGVRRVRLARFTQQTPFFKARLETLPDHEGAGASAESEALMRNASGLFESYVRLNGKLPPETMVSALNVKEPGQLADIIAAHLQVKAADKQRVLQAVEPVPRLEEVCRLLTHENEILEMERRIQSRVRRNMEKVQKEYYLQEQMKAIQKELGQKSEGDSETAALKKKVQQAGLPKDAREKALSEVERLERMAPYSAEASVSRTYLDWLLALPWSRRTQDNLDLPKAERILEEDHDGLKKAKARIVEYLAVRKLVEKLKGPILCFVGPPGVGKTSLAKSIARAMGRNFVRISLGGVRDEAEIRGHRRTYVGALPGRIIQSLRRAKSLNPVFLLDEVDKMSTDFRGDPSAALLEVLDPEQNATFTDHYLDTEFDLSEVFFITTANMLYEIPAPLRDRMEVIELTGYTEEEKASIARRFLIPKQVAAHGLKTGQFSLSEEALRKLIRQYTREAGVRNLEREITSLCRKAAKRVVENPKSPGLKVEAPDLHKYLGIPKYLRDDSLHRNEVGVATGLAWTETGGEVLSIEVTLMKGKGGLTLTGKLGDVMKESAQAALSYIRSRARRFGLAGDFHKGMDIHIHIPEGATPKDGPSAGITMATALVSALTGRAVKRGLAMTGEVTLRGRVLPIGGLKDKALAAHRAGFHTLLLPRLNQKDLEEVPAAIRSQIKFHMVSSMDQVLQLALEPKKSTAHERQRTEQQVPKAEIWSESQLAQ
jgi:ATP-dependent Lon protease